MKFKTRSGSWYELDIESNRVRRLIGVKDPTPRQGSEGEWKQLHQPAHVVIGSGAMFVWNCTPEGIYQTTVTSTVIEILEDEACASPN